MTIKELILELQQYDQNLKVKVDTGGERLSLSEVFVDEAENYVDEAGHETCIMLCGSVFHRD